MTHDPHTSPAGRSNPRGLRRRQSTGRFGSCRGALARCAAMRWGALAVLLAGCAESSSPPATRLQPTPAPPIRVVTPGPAGSLTSGLAQSSATEGSEPTRPGGCAWFTEVAEQAGLQFTYDNGSSGRLLMVEATGGGCGWIDFDRDGQWDVYLPQGGNPAAERGEPPRPTDELFRATGTERFVAVTASAGIDERLYGHGVAVGDFDNDGFDDVFVTNVGADVLWHNQGDGTFVDVTAGSVGFDNDWSSSAAWGDIDLDGDLDLYVCHYVDFDPYHPRICYNAQGQAATCHPDQMDPVPDECYLNNGDGTFRPVAHERGLFGPGNKALGVVIADFDNDGWPDIYVANDTQPNFLFINQQNAFFREVAATAGCAVNSNGSPQASMGVAVGDYDRNGYLDLYLTHFTQEWNTLYRNLGPEGFQDVTAQVGLVAPKLDKLGFGAVMADFDQDGFVELFVANGHIDDQTPKGRETAMVPQLFAWRGRRFSECTAQAGEFFTRKLIARGVASCDYDHDGDVDLLVVSQNAPAALLRNDSRRGHWLKFEFVGLASNRRGVGTRVTVRCGDRPIMQELAGGTSYCAAHEPALIFGLGDLSRPCDVEIRWPRGAVQVLRGVAPDQSLRLVEPPEAP